MKHFSFALSALAFALSAQAVRAEAPHPMGIEDLLTLKRVAAPVASPDGQWVVWQQTDTDPASYKRNAGLWRVASKGGTPERIADLPDAGETSPAFSPDGKRLYFISGKSGSDQLWLLDLAAPGAQPVQVPGDRAGVAPDLGLVLLEVVHLLDHDDRDGHVVFLEVKDGLGVVEKDVGVEDEHLLAGCGQPCLPGCCCPGA